MDERTKLEGLWRELLFDACASDGPIKDRDVLQAIQHYQPRIEAEVVRLERNKIEAMRKDHRTIPHGEFFQKWPDWRNYYEVLPSNCSCSDCRLWRSGS